MTKYCANSVEEFSRLEGLAKKLFNSLTIECSAELMVREGILDQIDVLPAEALGKIGRVYHKEGKPEVNFSDADGEHIVVELDKQQYNLIYKK